MGKLSERKTRDTKPETNDRWLGDGDGLWLRIRSSGTKTFVFRQKRSGKSSMETLGEWPHLSLQNARERIRERRRKDADPGAHTVRELCDRFYDGVIKTQHKRPHIYKRYLDRDLDRLHERRVSTVRRADLGDLLANKRKDGPVAANRLLGILKQLFSYGIEIGWLDDSPAIALTRRAAGGKEERRSRSLTDDEICLLWVVSERTAHGPLLRWLLLTGQRIGEAQRARWTDIRDGRWSIPDNKSNRPHWIPISSGMRKQLDLRSRAGQYLFDQRSATATQAWMRRWCEREDIKPPFKPHDLRRTFSTRLNGLGVIPQVVEKLLNHAMGGVLAVYNVHEYAAERAAALELWTKEVERIVLCPTPAGEGREAPEQGAQPPCST
jgi:integrase